MKKAVVFMLITALIIIVAMPVMAAEGQMDKAFAMDDIGSPIVDAPADVLQEDLEPVPAEDADVQIEEQQAVYNSEEQQPDEPAAAQQAVDTVIDWGDLKSILEDFNGRSMTVEQDITQDPADDVINVNAESGKTLDLNGHKISGRDGESIFSREQAGVFFIKDTSGSAQGITSINAPLINTAGGNTIIENGTFIVDAGIPSVSASTIEIKDSANTYGVVEVNGGTVTGIFSDKPTVNIKKDSGLPTIPGGPISLIVKGGTVENTGGGEAANVGRRGGVQLSAGKITSRSSTATVDLDNTLGTVTVSAIFEMDGGKMENTGDGHALKITKAAGMDDPKHIVKGGIIEAKGAAANGIYAPGSTIQFPVNADVIIRGGGGAVNVGSAGTLTLDQSLVALYNTGTADNPLYNGETNIKDGVIYEGATQVKAATDVKIQTYVPPTPPTPPTPPAPVDPVQRVRNEQELKNFINNPQVTDIIMLNDIPLSSTVNINRNTAITIDTSGYTLTGALSSAGTGDIKVTSTKGAGTIMLESGQIAIYNGNGSLTITNMVILAQAGNMTAVQNAGTGSITIENSMISNTGSAADAFSASDPTPVVKNTGSGSVNIKNGTIYSAGDISVYSPKGTVRILGGSVRGIQSSNIVNGKDEALEMYTLTFGNISEAQSVASLMFAPRYGYDIKYMKTDAKGGIYVWLPAGTEFDSAEGIIGEVTYKGDISGKAALLKPQSLIKSAEIVGGSSAYIGRISNFRLNVQSEDPEYVYEFYLADSNKGKASITKGGRLTAKSRGNLKIYARLTDKNGTTITVSKPFAVKKATSSFMLKSKENRSVLYKGAGGAKPWYTQLIIADAKPKDSSHSVRDMNWSSSDRKIATVMNGKVKIAQGAGSKLGTVTITAMDKGNPESKATFTIKVQRDQ